MDIPIPKLRSSWMAALIMFLFLFLLYYLVAFENLLKLYQSQFDVVYFEQSEMQLNVSAFVPHYYNASDAALAYVHVQNESDDPVYDVEVYLVASFDESTLLLPSVYTDDVYSSKSEFDVLPPNAISIARVSLVAQREPTITKVIIIQKQDGIPEELERLDPKDYVRIKAANWEALQHRFLEVILLPPWSNGYIFGLVILSMYLIRNGKEDTEPMPFTPEWWELVRSDLMKSFKVLVVMFLLTLLSLFTSKETLSRSLCIIAFLLILALRKKIWKENITEAFMKEVVVFFAFWLAVSGILFAVSGPLLALVVSLFPKLFPQIKFSLMWTNPSVNLVIFLIVFILAFFSRNYLNRLVIYTNQLRIWGMAFGLLGAAALIVLFFSSEYVIMEYVLWALLMSGGLWLLVIARSDVKVQDNRNKQVSISTQPSKKQGRR